MVDAKKLGISGDRRESIEGISAAEAWILIDREPTFQLNRSDIILLESCWWSADCSGYWRFGS